MNPLRRQLARGAGVPFDRLTAIALILAAVLPAAVLGLLVYVQVDRALGQDAVARTQRAVDAAVLHLEQAQSDLDALASSYATWPVFERMVATNQSAAVHDDVVAFLVEQGSVAAGRVDGPATAVTAGAADVAAALASLAPTSPATPTVLEVGGAVFLVTSQPIPDADAAGRTVGRITLARRLDAVFATGLATLTGYAVTLAGPDGVTTVATDPTSSIAALAATAGTPGVVRQGDIVATRTHLDGPGGGADLILSSQVSAVQATAGQLPILILALLLATALLALLLAALLARILHRRLVVVHDGLAAIADGRVPPVRATPQHDDIARVAAGLDRLVATLDHRESVLRRSLSAAAAVPIHLTAPEAGRVLARAAADIFDVAWVRIVEPDGTVLATAGAPAAPGGFTTASPSDGDPELVEAPTGLGVDGRRLEAGLRPSAPWSDGDQTSLEVMALLAGGVIVEAEQYGEAANRADRLERLNRLQREFLRGVSHNLRAPLATIELAATDLLERSGSPYIRERAAAVRTEERRLARLVSQVLLLSRMESGTLELEGEPVALGPLARRVAADLSLIPRVALVERASGAVAIADEAATEQIVWILLDNAARYAPAGPILVEVLPGLSRNGEPSITLAVQDEGPGVTLRDERRIFRRFSRGAASEGTEGTGVGLSVARGLARALGGDLVYRRSAAGARFEVTLPSSGPALEAELGSETVRSA